MKLLSVSAALLAAGVASAPAWGADDFHAPASLEQHRAAFAGATLRFDLDRRTDSAPQVRLGIGLSRYQRDQSGFLVGRGGPTLPVEAGLANGRLRFFVAGAPLRNLERRLGAAESNATTFAIVGGLAVGAVAVILLAGGDSDDGPCPPGVEVCAFQ